MNEFREWFSGIVQLYAQNETPSILELHHPRRGNAQIGISQGRVVFAQCQHVQGEEAFHTIMRWSHGEIVQRRFESPPVNIDKSLSALMLETYWSADTLGNLDETSAEDSTLELEYKPLELMIGDESMNRAHQEALWSEGLKNQLDRIEDLIGFQVWSIEPHDLTHISAEGLKNVHTPPCWRQTLHGVATAGPDFEVMLTWANQHHVVLPMAKSNAILHAVYRTQHLNLAKARWRTYQCTTKHDTRHATDASEQSAGA